MKIFIQILFIISLNSLTFALDQTGSIKQENEIVNTQEKLQIIFNTWYEIPIYDTSTFLSMEQTSGLYTTAYRLAGRGINTGFDTIIKYPSSLIVTIPLQGLFAFFSSSLAHEAGHQSILNYFNIPSTFYPTAIVADDNADLISLRNDHRNDFHRLHTSGMESQFILSNNFRRAVFFHNDSWRNISFFYHLNQLNVPLYLFTTDKTVTGWDNATDIVGNDLMSLLPNLFRPNDSYRQYSFWHNLTTDEKEYFEKIQYVSLISLLDSLLYTPKMLQINTLKMAGGFTASMAPFGYFTQFHYFLINAKLNLNGYIRIYFNQSYNFPAIGFTLYRFQIIDMLFISSSLDLWSQPANLDFTTKENEYGLGIDFTITMQIFNWAEIYLSPKYKTMGFIPGHMSLETNFSANVGVNIFL